MVERNYDNIQFADLRAKIEPEFNKAHDELTEAYYKYWKKGESYRVNIGGQEFDVQKDEKASKELFDKLHGLIFDLLQKAFHEENVKLSIEEKIPEDEYRYVKNELGVVTEDKYVAVCTKIDAIKTAEVWTVDIAVAPVSIEPIIEEKPK
jgi:hypothetical protein